MNHKQIICFIKKYINQNKFENAIIINNARVKVLFILHYIYFISVYYVYNNFYSNKYNIQSYLFENLINLIFIFYVKAYLVPTKIYIILSCYIKRRSLKAGFCNLNGYLFM